MSLPIISDRRRAILPVCFAFRYNGQTIPTIRDITSRLFPTQVGGFDLLNPTSLGEDVSGELYIVDYTSGNIFKIIPQTR